MNRTFVTAIRLLLFMTLFSAPLFGQDLLRLEEVISEKNSYEKMVKFYLKEYHGNDGSWSYSLVVINDVIRDSILGHRLKKGELEGVVSGEYLDKEVTLHQTSNSCFNAFLYARKNEIGGDMLVKVGQSGEILYLLIQENRLAVFVDGDLISHINLVNLAVDTVLNFNDSQLAIRLSDLSNGATQLEVGSKTCDLIILRLLFESNSQSESLFQGDFQYIFSSTLNDSFSASLGTELKYVNGNLACVNNYFTFNEDSVERAKEYLKNPALLDELMDRGYFLENGRVYIHYANSYCDLGNDVVEIRRNYELKEVH